MHRHTGYSLDGRHASAAVFAAVSALCVGSACKPASTPGAPAPPAAPSRDGASAAPIVSSGPEKPETASGLFAQLPPEEQARRSVIERMCTLAIGQYSGEFTPELEGELVFGCSCCPPFEQCPASDSVELMISDPNSVYPLRHWHEGRFTQAEGQQQLAATFMGCEPGAENRGGTLVFNARGDRLERVAYRSGVNPDSCQVLATSGQRDRLVCLQSAGMGSTNYTQLLLVDLAKDVGTLTEIASFDDDRTCLLEAEPYVSIRVAKVELVDANADGRLDVVVEAAARSGVLREAELATCTDETWAPTTLPPPTPERFVYLARGGDFVATQATVQRLEALYRLRNAHRGP